MKQYLNTLINNQTLTTSEAHEALLKIGKGEATPTNIASFLGMYAYKGVTVDELEGFRNAMLELAVQINLADFDAMDIVGTGGDGKDTFNISTTSAFVIAGAGQAVAKHGNHGVSSAVGSSTVLEYLGVKFTNDEDFLRKKLETANICFFHAPLFHPAMKYVAPIRKELGIKTFFNILGPLLNPAKVQKQFSGVYDLKVFDLYAELFKRTHQKFGIVYDLGGYDEISLTNDVKIVTNNDESKIHSFTHSKIHSLDLHGGSTTEEAAKILIDVLENKATEAQKQVVLTNAGVALSIAREIGIEDGISQAKESLESGKAYLCFKKLIES